MALGRRSAARDAAAICRQGRPAIWSVLLALHARGVAATVLELERASYVSRRTVASYLEALVAGGFAVRLPPGRERGGARFILSGEPSRSPPRVRPGGEPVTQGGGRDRLWRSAKMLKVFTAGDLAIAASVYGAPVRFHEARTYLGFLHRGGYLAVQAPPSTTPGEHRRTTYRFIRNTGPLAPMVTRSRAVWDPNLQALTWEAGPRPGTNAAGGGTAPPAHPGGMSPSGLQQGNAPNAEDP